MTTVFNNTTKEQIMKLFSHDFISFKHNLKTEEKEVPAAAFVLVDARHAKLEEVYVKSFRKASLGVDDFIKATHQSKEAVCYNEVANSRVRLSCRVDELSVTLGILENRFTKLREFVHCENYNITSQEINGRSL